MHLNVLEMTLLVALGSLAAVEILRTLNERGVAMRHRPVVDGPSVWP